MLTNLIGRQLIVRLFTTFVVALMVPSGVLLSALMAEADARYDLGPSILIRLIPVFLPRTLAYAIPSAWLFSVCSVYGTLAWRNELIALKTAGISPLKVIAPAFVLSGILAIPVVWLISTAFSSSVRDFERVVADSATEMIQYRLKRDHQISVRNIAIRVQGVMDEQLIRPSFHLTHESGECISGAAASGFLKYDLRTGELILHLTNGSIRKKDGILEFEQSMPLQLSFRNPDDVSAGRWYSMSDLWHEVWTRRKKIAQMEDRFQQLKDLHKANSSASVAQSFENHHEQLLHERDELDHVIFKILRRLSFGFCCVSFVMFGLPLAILLRCSNAMTTFFFAFAPILLYYYPTELAVSHMQHLPAIAAPFLSHGALITGGLVLMWRVYKY